MYPIDHFHRQARLTPDLVAVEHQTGSMSYRELHSKACAFAAALQDIDPEPGSRVGACCFNHIDHLLAWLGILAAGKIWVPLYPKNKAEEIGRSVEFTGMTIVIADPEARHLVEGGSARVLTTSPDDGAETVPGLVKRYLGKQPTSHFLPLGETQAIKFTGGSTGAPKGVMQTYRSWNAMIATQIYAWEMTGGVRCLLAAPMTHGNSTYILPVLGSGGTLVILDRARPEEIVDYLSNHNIQMTFLPPTVIYMMMQVPGVQEMDFSRLKSLIYGAAPMRPEDIKQAQEVFGPRIAVTYGQTEVPQIATMMSAADLMREDKRASIGQATFLTRVAVLDKDGQELPASELGEIVMRGDMLMSGYWNQPEKTAETIRNGWLHTGDLGTFDEEGFLFIKGRSKDVIISGGFNVYPADVEPVIAEHEAVGDCAVFGVPDPKWGEAVHAAVEFVKDRSADPEEILKMVKERLGSVKAPKSIVVYERLPRNAYDKLQKQVLIDDFEKALNEEKERV